MTERDQKLDEAFEGFDQGKRETLTRLVTGSAFVAPVVASFVMQGLSIRPAHAQLGSSSNATITSDMRLKRNIVRITTHPKGFGIYRFNYLWSDKDYVGTIAQDVLQHVPEAVTTGPGNYLAVDYDALGISMREEVHAP